MMKVHTLAGYIQHIYLVETPGGLLLLDGCSRADAHNVCRFITDTLNRSLTDLKLIVVTHMHPDHAGGAHKLRKLTGAKIAAHPKAAKWYSGVMGRAAHLIDVSLTWWVAGRLGKPKKHIWYSPILKPDIILLDEQTLPGFEDWQVLFTPGHTDHDITLYHGETSQAYVADLMVSVKRQLTPPYPICHPNQYKQSLKRIQTLQPQTVFCAHVPPLSINDIDFEAIIQQAPVLPKNHWHSAKNRIAHALGGQNTAH